ncbi:MULTISPECIES: recombinase family protein [unclassified Streptomyces]|uniref:recombinase family protein n=1 Tax=unclassified Streptomyces TaxID=2593676 RepID=UPI000C277AE1|nr:recombinase family protein [Streptomyces sp. CB02959]PJN40749.1 hypothetical protein CG747_10430 [Streptomyces sp. CB02959]
MASQDLEGLRGGIYARKSNYHGKKYNRGRSVKEQLDNGHADADELKIKVVEEYVDDGQSASRHGAKDERDGFERLMSDIEAKNLDIVIAWAATRLQRDLTVYTRLRDACAKHSVLWCYGGKVYDLSNKDDRFRTGLDALLGEREVDELRDNVLRAMRANAVGGRPHGPSPYGYRRVYDPDTGAFVRVEPDPDEAPIVREICVRVAAGQSYKAIAQRLNERGVPAPALMWGAGMVKRLAREKPDNLEHESLWRETQERLEGGERAEAIAKDFHARGEPMIAAVWRPDAIKTFAGDVRYIGARTYHGEVTADNAWPALVRKATFTRCQAIIKDRGKLGRNSRPGKARYWLTSIMVCGECNSPIQSQKTASGKVNYVCKQPGRDGERGYHTSAQMTPVDRYVRDWLFGWLSSPRFVEAYTRGDEKLVRQIEEAQAEAKLLRERLDGFYLQAAKGGLSPEGLGAIEAEIQPHITAADERARTLRAPSVVRDIVGVTPEEVAAAWGKLELPQQRMIAEALLDVRLSRVGRGMNRKEAVPAERYVSVKPRKLFAPAA